MTTPPLSKDARAAVWAGFLGWTLDAFDFFLVVMTLTAIAQEFHRTDHEIAWSLTLTLLARPVGALIFGLLSDRYGRRLPLMINLVFYALIEVLTGFSTSYGAFLVLRALFGIGMGGEWGVGASLVMEKVPAERRGFYSGLLQQGYAFGYLLAAGAYWFVFPRWGWRPLFLIGGLPALLAVFVRAQVTESEVWLKTKVQTWSGLGRTLVKQLPLFLYLTLLMALMNMSSHGTQDLYPTFLQRAWNLGAGGRSGVTIVSMFGALIGGVVFGHWSQTWGRRKTIIATLLAAVLVIPLWAYAPSLGLLVAGAFLMQVFVQGAWGVIPAHITELAPDQVRGALPGFAYQCGAAIAGLMPSLQTRVAGTLGYPATMALSAGAAFLICALVTALGKEKRGVVYGETG
ncbi:MAG TPA: MFS transporter [Gemmatimonadales bacterium]|nr:MFS transporter [Gemmatimonadales bacterium]